MLKDTIYFSPPNRSSSRNSERRIFIQGPCRLDCSTRVLVAILYRLGADMARSLRQDFAGTAHHVILRGRNREPVFAHDGDRWTYLTLLKQHARDSGCDIYAWALLSNHVHLLAGVRQDHGLARCLQIVNGVFSRVINQDRMRMGSNWQAHAKIKPVVFEDYFQSCLLYIECNALKAGLADEPMEYPWSSCRFHCRGLPDGLTASHAWYDGLGSSPKARQEAFRILLTDYTRRMRSEMALGGKTSTG